MTFDVLFQPSGCLEAFFECYGSCVLQNIFKFASYHKGFVINL